VPPVNKHCHSCFAGEGKKPQRLRERKPLKKTKGRRPSLSVEKLTHLGGENPEDKSWSSRMGGWT